MSHQHGSSVCRVPCSSPWRMAAAKVWAVKNAPSLNPPLPLFEEAFKSYNCHVWSEKGDNCLGVPCPDSGQQCAPRVHLQCPVAGSSSSLWEEASLFLCYQSIHFICMILSPRTIISWSHHVSTTCVFSDHSLAYPHSGQPAPLRRGQSQLVRIDRDSPLELQR